MSCIELLDCTLRDGSYITASHFGEAAIRGIITKMQEAHVNVIECGWLKDKDYESGTTFYHVPSDLQQYLTNKNDKITYAAMIDWDRYDVDNNLPKCDGKSIDAIRVVFPHGKHREGIDIGKKIREKGYKVFFQAANTLAYSNEDLHDLALCINEFKPVSISVVDTFGAMYPKDLERVVSILDAYLDKNIKIGFHSHNNQQLSFALTMQFIDILKKTDRDMIVDASLCGMGRGAGNATTELVTSYLNRTQNGDYDMNAVLDAIDMYMAEFKEKYEWGYSTPYFLAGIFQTHVNNVVYLKKNHRTNAADMSNIFESLSTEERRHYDYKLLEDRYIENQDRIVDDQNAMEKLGLACAGKSILMIAPGKSIVSEFEKVQEFIQDNAPAVIGVNALIPAYHYDYVFFTNSVRYQYATEVYPDLMRNTKKILLSNIKTHGDTDEYIVNFNKVIKRGWEHFDNAVILCLRLMDRLNFDNIYIAGFDGFKHEYNASYADSSLPTLNPNGKWDELNTEIKDMYMDFRKSTENKIKITFVTESFFE